MTTEISATGGPYERPRGTTLSEYAATVIKDLILWEEIPPGTRLNEVELAERLNVSRTPVREALRWLQAEGTVTRQGAGLTAAPFDLGQATELLRLRQMIEPFVSAESAKRLEPRDLSQLRALAGQMGELTGRWTDTAPREMAELELGFHRLLNSRCPYERIAAVVENARDAHSLLRMHRVQTDAQRAKSMDDHNELVRAAELVAQEQADPSTMHDAMAEHLAVSMTYLVSYVEQFEKDERAASMSD